VGFEGGSRGQESAEGLREERGRFCKSLTRRNLNRQSPDRACRLPTLLSLSGECDSLSLGGGGLGGHSGGRWLARVKVAGGLSGTGGYFPLGNSSASQGCRYCLANASGLPYSVGGEVDLSYLTRSGSAKGEGHRVLGGGGAGAVGALSFPFSSRVGLVLPVGVGCDLPE